MSSGSGGISNSLPSTQVGGINNQVLGGVPNAPIPGPGGLHVNVLGLAAQAQQLPQAPVVPLPIPQQAAPETYSTSITPRIQGVATAIQGFPGTIVVPPGEAGHIINPNAVVWEITSSYHHHHSPLEPVESNLVQYLEDSANHKDLQQRYENYQNDLTRLQVQRQKAVGNKAIVAKPLENHANNLTALLAVQSPLTISPDISDQMQRRNAIFQSVSRFAIDPTMVRAGLYPLADNQLHHIESFILQQALERLKTTSTVVMDIFTRDSDRIFKIIRENIHG